MTFLLEINRKSGLFQTLLRFFLLVFGVFSKDFWAFLMIWKCFKDVCVFQWYWVFFKRIGYFFEGLGYFFKVTRIYQKILEKALHETFTFISQMDVWFNMDLQVSRNYFT